jgi:hypothetical protein
MNEPVRISKATPNAAFPSFENTCNDDEREIAELERAWGKAATFFRTGMRFGHAPNSICTMSLQQVHDLLQVFRSRLQRGDTLSLLQAVALCAEENVPLPEWLATEFRARIKAFLQPGQHTSLDEVFRSENVPANSSKRAAAARQDWMLAGRLWHDAFDVAREDATLSSVDSVVTRLLSKRNYGVAKTKAKKLIGMVEANQSEFLRKDVSLSRFLAERRKPAT